MRRRQLNCYLYNRMATSVTKLCQSSKNFDTLSSAELKNLTDLNLYVVYTQTTRFLRKIQQDKTDCLRQYDKQ